MATPGMLPDANLYSLGRQTSKVRALVGFTSVIIAMLLTNGFPIWAAIGITLLSGFAIGAFMLSGLESSVCPLSLWR
jgi:hypothetical protein